MNDVHRTKDELRESTTNSPTDRAAGRVREFGPDTAGADADGEPTATDQQPARERADDVRDVGHDAPHAAVDAQQDIDTEAAVLWSFHEAGREYVPLVEAVLDHYGLLDPSDGPRPSELETQRFLQYAAKEGLMKKRRPLSWREFLGALPFGAARRTRD